MLKEVLKKFSIEKLNQMQEDMLNVFNENSRILLLSPTGSGKTLGFLLPLYASLPQDEKYVKALIIAPTRELALQIEQVFKKMTSAYKVTCCYGGHAVKVEAQNLLEPPTVLIGTPGRICHHIRDKNIKLDKTEVLIIDEFDKSLELGFKEEIKFILDHISVKKKIFTSATKTIYKPDFIDISDFKELNYLTVENKSLEQKVVIAKENDKLDALVNLLQKIGNEATLIFCNHRDAVERISELLSKQKVVHAIFHGKLEQQDREKEIIKFRNGTSKILVTTDLASRGLDIPEIKNVVHYQIPEDKNSFIHRNGRTARMHAEGTSYIILKEGETMPDFVEGPTTEEILSPLEGQIHQSEWETLYIGGGKKDKINKVDIVGLLLQKGGLEKDDLGKIEVLDFCAYAAVKRTKIKSLSKIMGYEKIKKKSVKIDIAR